MRCRGGGGVARRKGCGARWGNPNQSRTQSPGPVRRAGGMTQSCCDFPQQPWLAGIFNCLRRRFPHHTAIIRQSAGGTTQSCCDFPQQPETVGVFSIFTDACPSAAAGGRGKRTDSVQNLHSSAAEPACSNAVCPQMKEYLRKVPVSYKLLIGSYEVFPNLLTAAVSHNKLLCIRMIRHDAGVCFSAKER